MINQLWQLNSPLFVPKINSPFLFLFLFCSITPWFVVIFDLVNGWLCNPNLSCFTLYIVVCLFVSYVKFYGPHLTIKWSCIFHQMQKKMSYGSKISFFLLCLSNQCTITYVLYNRRVMNLLLLLFLLVCECVCVCITWKITQIGLTSTPYCIYSLIEYSRTLMSLPMP